jgi:hypothetical protein
MLGDINETLGQLLVDVILLGPSELDVGFEDPQNEWLASPSKPTVKYLYDIGEDHELHNYDWITECHESGWS